MGRSFWCCSKWELFHNTKQRENLQVDKELGVEQCVVYSIYYNGTLVLTLGEGRGECFSCWCLGERNENKRHYHISIWGAQVIYCARHNVSQLYSVTGIGVSHWSTDGGWMITSYRSDLYTLDGPNCHKMFVILRSGLLPVIMILDHPHWWFGLSTISTLGVSPSPEDWAGCPTGDQPWWQRHGHPE